MNDKPKRRRFRFSLRTLLVFVTIASAGFGWLGMKVRAKQREREAVKAIQELGGLATYDYELDVDSLPKVVSPKPSKVAWPRYLHGDDFFADVVLVEFGPNTTDEDLAHLAVLNNLKVLYLEATQVTDEGLVPLMGLRQLTLLTLDGTQVTDAGVEQLQKALPNLEIRR